MKYDVGILGIVFVGCVAAAAAASSEYVPNAADTSQQYAIIKDILIGIIKNLEGEKTQFFEKLEINSENRFEKVKVESVIPKIIADIGDSNTKVSIKNMTVPIKLLEANGIYTLDDIVLPGGLTIYGNGNFKIRFEELNVFFRLEVKYSSAKGSWKVQDVEADASLKSVLIKFENLMNGEPFGDFIHDMINKIIPVFVDLLNGLVEENKTPLMEILTDIINRLKP